MNSYYKLFFVVLIICCNWWINNVLEVQAIVGSNEAFQYDYKYHAAVLGKRNYSDVLFLICSGAIVSAYMILSAAHCFIDEEGEPKELTFYLRVGSKNLYSDQGQQKLLDFIYLFHYNFLTGENDFALARMTWSMYFKQSDSVSKLYIPYFSTQVFQYEATVTGYGISNVTKDTDRKLRYAFVRPIDASHCSNNSRPIYRTQFCGMMKLYPDRKPRGLCKYDGGAPLVVGDEMLIGIAGMHRPDCDDTKYGSIYTNLPLFKEIIESVQSGNALAPQIIPNRKHVLYKSPIAA